MEKRIHPKGMVALTALGLLSEQPYHPYEIQRLLRERHKDYAVGKTRALYRAIEELEAGGFIESVETSREGKRPERTVYRITDEGREELHNWLTDVLQTPAREYPVFNVAMALIAYLPQERAEAALWARTVVLRAELAAHQEALRGLQEELQLPRIVLLEIEHGMALREAELRWVHSIIEEIRDGSLRWNEALLRQHFETMHEAQQARRLAALKPLHTARESQG